MDPDTALESARRAQSKWNDASANGDVRMALEAGDELSKAFEAIDQWMTKGGFPPRGWTKVEP